MIKNEKDMLSCVSFLLGKTHGAIAVALQCDTEFETVEHVREIERMLSTEVSRLYYPDPHDHATNS